MLDGRTGTERAGGRGIGAYILNVHHLLLEYVSVKDGTGNGWVSGRDSRLTARDSTAQQTTQSSDTLKPYLAGCINMERQDSDEVNGSHYVRFSRIQLTSPCRRPSRSL